MQNAGDLDLGVTEKGLEQLKQNYDVKEKPGNPNWYIVSDKVECVLDDMEGRKEKFGDMYLQDIDNYLEYLKGSNREKDKARIPLVENYIHRREYVRKYATIETPRLILRKAKESDLTDINNNIWSDASLATNMLWKPNPDLETAKRRLSYNIFLHNNNFSYFIVLKETNQVIGWTGIHEIEPHLFEDYGICIATRYHGQGLGKEVMTALEDLAFEKLGGEKFIYTCFSTNKQSSGLCTSLGFTYKSSTPRVREHDGLNYILDTYELEYDKYKELKNNKIK